MDGCRLMIVTFPKIQNYLFSFAHIQSEKEVPKPLIQYVNLIEVRYKGRLIRKTANNGGIIRIDNIISVSV